MSSDEDAISLVQISIQPICYMTCRVVAEGLEVLCTRDLSRRRSSIPGRRFLSFASLVEHFDLEAHSSCTDH